MMKVESILLVGILFVGLVTALDKACEDAEGEEYCIGFLDNGYCTRLPKTAYEKCASSCDICNGPPCEDKKGKEYCTAKKKWCERFTSTKERLCRKTCGTCTGKYDV